MLICIPDAIPISSKVRFRSRLLWSGPAFSVHRSGPAGPEAEIPADIQLLREASAGRQQHYHSGQGLLQGHAEHRAGIPTIRHLAGPSPVKDDIASTQEHLQSVSCCTQGNISHSSLTVIRT